jgi:hypothetical protein
MSNEELEPGILYIDLEKSEFSNVGSRVTYYTHDPLADSKSYPEAKFLSNLPANALKAIGMGKLNELDTSDCNDLKRAARFNGDNPELEPDPIMVYGKALNYQLFIKLMPAIAVPAFFGGFVLGLTIASATGSVALGAAVAIAFTFGLMNTAKSTPVEMMLAISSAMEAINEKERKRILDQAQDAIADAENVITYQLGVLGHLDALGDNIEATYRARHRPNVEIMAAKIRIKEANDVIDNIDIDTDWRLAPITDQPFFNFIFNDTFLTVFSDWFPMILSMITTVGLKEVFETTGMDSALAAFFCSVIYPVATSALHTFITAPTAQMLLTLKTLSFSVEHSWRVSRASNEAESQHLATFNKRMAATIDDIAIYSPQSANFLAEIFAQNASAAAFIARHTKTPAQVVTKVLSSIVAELATGRYLAMVLPLEYGVSAKTIAAVHVATLASVNAALVSLSIDSQIICALDGCYKNGGGILLSFLAGSPAAAEALLASNPGVFIMTKILILSALFGATSMVAISAYKNILSRIEDVENSLKEEMEQGIPASIPVPEGENSNITTAGFYAVVSDGAEEEKADVSATPVVTEEFRM